MASKKTSPKKAAAKKAAPKKAAAKKTTKVVKATQTPVEYGPTEDYAPSESVIKEIMVQKSVTREQAIDILKNPAK